MSAGRVTWQRSSLYAEGIQLWHYLGRLRSLVVVGQLDPQLAGIFAFAREALPEIVLASTRYYNMGKINPGFANEVCSLVLAEHRDLDFIVIRRVVYDEAKFLIPEHISGISIDSSDQLIVSC